MAVIQNILGRMVIDSRGNPTVEAEVLLNDGSIGRSSVPSGASTGSKEAIELRDNNKSIYLGKGVSQAINNINKVIAPALKGKSVDDQSNLDSIMLALDGTDNKSNLGAMQFLQFQWPPLMQEP